MRNKRLKATALLMLALFLPLSSWGQVEIKSVDGFPSGETGYSLGVSACYAGMIGNKIIVAGGCNFPEKGKKKYYQGIYAAEADTDSLHWKLVGYLPEPAAYGGVVAMGDSLIFVGGNNSQHSLSTVISVRYDEKSNKAVTRQLQSLPYTADNMAVAQSGDSIFLFGGNQDGIPSTSLLCWNASGKQGWKYMSRIPGAPRVQPVCVADAGKVYVWGGFYADGLYSKVATCGYRYDADSDKWTSLDAPCDDDGKELTLTGGIATISGHNALCLGGVNKDIFLDAISGGYKLVKQEDYLKKDIPWYHFNGNLLRYDITEGAWEKNILCDPRLARAGAQLVKWSDRYFYIGGELKPSVRTPEILLIY